MALLIDAQPTCGYHSLINQRPSEYVRRSGIVNRNGHEIANAKKITACNSKVVVSSAVGPCVSLICLIWRTKAVVVAAVIRGLIQMLLILIMVTKGRSSQSSRGTPTSNARKMHIPA